MAWCSSGRRTAGCQFDRKLSVPSGYVAGFFVAFFLTNSWPSQRKLRMPPSASVAETKNSLSSKYPPALRCGTAGKSTATKSFRMSAPLWAIDDTPWSKKGRESTILPGVKRPGTDALGSSVGGKLLHGFIFVVRTHIAHSGLPTEYNQREGEKNDFVSAVTVHPAPPTIRGAPQR